MKKKSLLFVLLMVMCLSMSITAYAASGSWKSDSNGWWYQYSNGSYATGWASIGGEYYYFDNSGYMASSEYRDGYWINGNGTWNANYSNAHWDHDDIGWWYTDSSGWYPVSQWLKIDGSYYYFKSNGYLATDEYIDDMLSVLNECKNDHIILISTGLLDIAHRISKDVLVLNNGELNPISHETMQIPEIKEAVLDILGEADNEII